MSRLTFAVCSMLTCHWGTDITHSLAMASYAQRITQFTEELDFLTEEDKGLIAGRIILERLSWA